MNAIDTNVLAYSVDSDGEEKRVRALALLAELPPGGTVVLWQVACELGAVLAKFARQGRADCDPEAVIGAVTTRFRLVLPSEGLVHAGLGLRRTYQVSYWDALLIAGCIDAGVTRLFTEDLQGRPAIEGVEFINPFL